MKMKIMMSKNRIWVKIVATIVVCLFSVNTLAEAAPGRIVSTSSNTLQPQLKSKPMVDIAETQYKVQVRYEFHHIIEMVIKGQPFLKINAALDIAAGTGTGRVLDVRDDFLETDDGVVLKIGFLKGTGGDPEFHVFFDKRCKSIMDLLDNEDLIRYVDAPSSTDEGKPKTQNKFFANLSKLRKKFEEVEQTSLTEEDKEEAERALYRAREEAGVLREAEYIYEHVVGSRFNAIGKIWEMDSLKQINFYNNIDNVFNPGSFASMFRMYYPTPNKWARAIFDEVLAKVSQEKYSDIYWDAYVNKKFRWHIKFKDKKDLDVKLNKLGVLKDLPQIKMPMIHLNLIEYLQTEIDYIPKEEIDDLINGANMINQWVTEGVRVDEKPGNFIRAVRAINTIAFMSSERFHKDEEGLHLFRWFEVKHGNRPRIYPDAGFIDKMMAELDMRVRSSEFKMQHPVMQAAEVYISLRDIHPFADGNERTAKLMMNYYLMKNRYPPLDVTPGNKEEFAKVARFMNCPQDFAIFLAEQLKKYEHYYRSQGAVFHNLVSSKDTVESHMNVSTSLTQIFRKLADEVKEAISSNENPVILLSMGNTMRDFYGTELLRRAKLDKDHEDHIDLSKVTFILSDEFVGTQERYDSLQAEFISKLPQDNRPVDIIRFEDDGRSPKETVYRFTDRLAEFFPVDLALMGIGVNGHLAYAEIGSPYDSGPHISSLHRSTRWYRDIKHTRAFTVGLGDILAAKRIVVVGATSSRDQKASKAEAVRYAIETLEVPASAVRTHKDANFVFLLDEDSASLVSGHMKDDEGFEGSPFATTQLIEKYMSMLGYPIDGSSGQTSLSDEHGKGEDSKAKFKEPFWYVKELLDEEMDTYFERRSPSAPKENLVAFHRVMVSIVDKIISEITKDGVTVESAMVIINETLDKHNATKADDILRWVFLRLLRDGEWDLLSRFIEYYHFSKAVEQECLTKKYMLYLETLLGENSEKRHMIFTRQMEALDVPTQQFGHIPFLNILRLKKQLNYQAITESRVRGYLLNRLSRYDYESEWVSLKYLNYDGLIGAAISYLLNMTGHENKSERREVLMENLYAREFDKGLYFRKTHMEHYPDDSGFDVHADRDNPYREMAAFIIGRQIGANTAKTAITEQGYTFSALSIMPEKEDLLQEDAKAAESAALVFNVLIRRWDDSRDMIQRSPVGESFISFDHDVAFNPEYMDIEKYISTLKELGEAKNQRWSVEDFDIEVIRETIEKVRAMDVDEVIRLIEKQLSAETIKTNMGETEVNLFPYIKRYLMVTMDSIEEDTREAFKAMTGSDLNMTEGRAQSFLATTFDSVAWKIFTLPSTIFHEAFGHYLWAWTDWKRGVTKYQPIWSERDIFEGEVVNVYGKAKMFGGIVGNIVGLIAGPVMFFGFANMFAMIFSFNIGFPAACILMAYPFTLNLISILSEIIAYFYDMGDLVEGREMSYETEERDKPADLEKDEIDEIFDEEDDPVSIADLKDLAVDIFSDTSDLAGVVEAENMTFEFNPGIDREQILEELKEDVGALKIRWINGKYTVVINGEFSEPTILAKAIRLYGSILQGVIDGNNSLASFLVDNSDTFLGYDAMSDFQRVLMHNKYEPRDRRDPRKFIKQYINTVYAVGKRDISKLPEKTLRKLLVYRKFKLDYLRRTDPESKEVLLADEAKNIREVVVVTDKMRRNPRDPNWSDPNVMLIDDMGFKFGRWRGKNIPGEKIIFAKWRGKTFMFYISRSHTSMGTEIHLWRNCDYVDVIQKWFKKNHPENTDDLTGKLKILLDVAIYSKEMKLEKISNKTFYRAMGSGYPEKGISKGINFSLIGKAPYERLMPRDEKPTTAGTQEPQTADTVIPDYDMLEDLDFMEDTADTLVGDDLDSWELKDYELEKDKFKIELKEEGLSLKYSGEKEDMPYDFFEWCSILKAFELVIVKTSKGTIRAEMLDPEGRVMHSMSLSFNRAFGEFFNASKQLVYEQPFYAGPFSGIVKNVHNDRIYEFKIESDGRTAVKFSRVERFAFGREIEFGTDLDKWQYWDNEKREVSREVTDYIQHNLSGTIERRITEEKAARIAKKNDTLEIYPDDYVGRFTTASGMTQIMPQAADDPKKDQKDTAQAENAITSTHRIAQQILSGRRGIKAYLNKNKEVPIDITVDLALISREDLDENMKTWAYLVLMVGNLENVNFIFEHPLEGEENLSDELANDLKNAPSIEEAVTKLKTEIENSAKGRILDFNVEDIINLRINTGRRKDAIEVPITSKAWLKWIDLTREEGEEIKANQYPVALKRLTSTQNGVALRNFYGAVTIGLTTAALVIAKRKGELKEVMADGRLLKKLQELYSKLLPKKRMPLDEEILTECIISSVPSARINLAISLALPPIMRDAVKLLEVFHKNIRRTLIAA
ncbi:Fic family protein [Candidatus Omnitrophota bacterium]